MCAAYVTDDHFLNKWLVILAVPLNNNNNNTTPVSTCVDATITIFLIKLNVTDIKMN